MCILTFIMLFRLVILLIPFMPLTGILFCRNLRLSSLTLLESSNERLLMVFKEVCNLAPISFILFIGRLDIGRILPLLVTFNIPFIESILDMPILPTPDMTSWEYEGPADFGLSIGSIKFPKPVFIEGGDNALLGAGL